MISFDEYKLKKQKLNKQALEILTDDSNDSTLYTLHMCSRENGLILDCGVFRYYSNLEESMDSRIEFEELANDEDYSAADFEWFEISKYILLDDKYKQKIAVKMAFDYRLIHYYLDDDIEIPEELSLEQDVATPYETGDIIKIKNAPLSDDYYGIYICDGNQEGNKHIQMTSIKKLIFLKFIGLK